MSSLYGLIIATQAYAKHIHKFSYRAEFTNNNGDKMQICFSGSCYICTYLNGELVTDKGVKVPFMLNDWADVDAFTEMNDE